jgi:hypothetical protein
MVWLRKSLKRKVKYNPYVNIGNRIGNAWSIFKQSFVLLKRDKSLAIVPIVQLISGIAFLAALFVVYLSVDIDAMETAIQYLLLVIFLFITYLWTTLLSSIQSWMVHEVAQGKDATLASGVKRAAKNSLDIILFAGASVLIALIASRLRRKGFAGRAAASGIEFVTGVAKQLVLPAMIVTERSFFQAVKQLKESVRVIPEILTYEIGMGPLLLIATLAVTFFDFFVFIIFGSIAAIAVLLIWFVFLIILSNYTTTTYYTLLYLTLIEKKKISGLEGMLKKRK